MQTVTLTRIRTGNQGTFGILEVGEFVRRTAELPKRGNRRNVSCIPAGEYLCSLVRSPRFGTVYHVKAVPGRSAVLIHSGNYAGDRALGWRSHSHGCILAGSCFGQIEGQLAVQASRPALRQFMNYMAGQPFILKIQEAFRNA